jgi:hypothetical protein
MVDETNDIPFCEAYTYLALRGIFLVTADLSSTVRKRIASILSDSSQIWSVVLATSAVAEGNNMKQLKSVFVLVKQPNANGFFPVYKVVQETGRVDREDQGGIAFCPDPKRLGQSKYKSFPISAVGEIVGSSINLDVFLKFFISV